MISAIYPSALDSGISAERFWDLTIKEINDAIKADQRKRKVEIDHLFVLADAIGTRIAYFFSDPKERSDDIILYKWDVYPHLFENERDKASEAQEERELEEFKSRRLAFANRWNQRFREENNGSGSSQADSVDRGTD